MQWSAPFAWHVSKPFFHNASPIISTLDLTFAFMNQDRISAQVSVSTPL